MKLTLTALNLKEIFVNWNRDYYSVEGLEAILNYYDEIDENMELDVIGICCDCTEYGDDAAMDWESFFNDYGNYYPVSEYCEDNDIERESDDDIDREEYAEQLANTLADYTTVLRADNGNYIVFEF